LRHHGALLDGRFGATESHDRSQREEDPSHAIQVRADRLRGPIFCTMRSSLGRSAWCLPDPGGASVPHLVR
jgi:hypothetical protein